MKKLSGIWLALCVSWFVQATDNNPSTVYYWTDAKGVMHFSDTPVPGKATQSKSVDIANPPTSNPNPVPVSSVPSGQSNGQPAVTYSLNIVSPVNQETIRSNEGKISVQNELTPALPENEQASLFLYVDSTKYQCSTSALSCQGDNIDRGTHQLKTELVSQSGKILASSQPVTVYLFRTIIAK